MEKPLPIDEINYVIYDVETNMLNKGEGAIGKSASAPWSAKNHIVAYGLKYQSRQAHYDEIKLRHEKIWPLNIDYLLWSTLEFYANQKRFYQPFFFVGSNLKFDLHYTQKHYFSKKPIDKYLAIMKQCRFWDCMVVEYLLSGQQWKFASLEDLSKYYGGPGKLDYIKKNYWDKGIDTGDIPVKELLEYLKVDIQETERVFRGQYERVLKNPEIYNLIISQMEFLGAIHEMEYNGMAANKDLMLEKAKEISLRVQTRADLLNDILKEACGFETPNCNSPQQLSIYLFGGEWTEDTKVPDLDENGQHKRFKSGLKKGELRYKKAVVTKEFPGKLSTKAKKGKTGYYSTAEDIISKLTKRKHIDEDTRKFCELLLENRTDEKDLNTYYIGFFKLIWEDGCIHGNLNQTVTNTGRLSSSQPNLQNLSNE